MANCRNPLSPHECHPAYAKRYDGYCLDCANACVPELVAENARLRAVLKSIEWGGDSPDACCPGCFRVRHVGHSPGCPVAGALEEK